LNSQRICKHIVNAPQANPQTKALSKRLQSQPKQEKKFLKMPEQQNIEFKQFGTMTT